MPPFERWRPLVCNPFHRRTSGRRSAATSSAPVAALWAWRCAPLPAQTECWRLQTSSSEITLTRCHAGFCGHPGCQACAPRRLQPKERNCSGATPKPRSAKKQSIKLWTQPILFLGDSLAHGMHAAAVCAAARAGVEPVGGARLTLASTKGRLPYNSSKVGAAAARQRIGLVNPEFRSAAKRMTESGGGTLVACIGMHYNNHPTSGLMSSLLHPRPGTIVEMIVTLSREDFREDVRLHMPTRTLHRTRPFSPRLPSSQPMTPNTYTRPSTLI